jgi:hypothetical protein
MRYNTFQHEGDNIRVVTFNKKNSFLISKSDFDSVNPHYWVFGGNKGNEVYSYLKTAEGLKKKYLSVFLYGINKKQKLKFKNNNEFDFTRENVDIVTVFGNVRLGENKIKQISNGVIEVLDSNNLVFYISEQDKWLLENSYWWCDKYKGVLKTAYRDGKKINQRMHSLISGLDANLYVVHKDGNIHNNTRDNLDIRDVSIPRVESVPNKLVSLKNGIAEYQLSSGKTFFISEQDMSLIDRFFTDNQNKYVSSSAKNNRKNIFLHRLIMNPPKGMSVDHINGNGYDNRRENLRVCTHSENLRNTKVQKGRISKGVYWNKAALSWTAYINIDGQRIILGNFTDMILAQKVYNKAAEILFGEYARLVDISNIENSDFYKENKTKSVDERKSLKYSVTKLDVLFNDLGGRLHINNL